jgi:DNA-binding MarR family transcriptional regulator
MQHALKVIEAEWPVSLQQSFKHATARTQRCVSPNLDSRTAAQARRAQEILHARVRRRQYFSPRLFSDPAWDVLLELYVAELAQWKMSVSSLGVDAGIPPTTVLRWLEILQNEGLVKRAKDPLDGRRVFVTLTDDGCEAMAAYFEVSRHG